MKINQLKIGMRVLMPSPASMLPRHRKRVAGVVVARYKHAADVPMLFNVWARNIEPKGAAGWHTASELQAA
jgi:hypothetical protein